MDDLWFTLGLGGAPCKNCEKREIGCHSDCEEYNEYRKHNTEAQTKLYRENLQMNTEALKRHIKRKLRRGEKMR